MTGRRLFLLIFTVILSGGLACSQGQDTTKPSQRTEWGPARGSQAPDFELKVLGGQGKTLRLSSLKGKAVVVSFWATWCEPCKIEMPWLVELQKKYGAQGLQVVGVNLDDAAEKPISQFARKMKVNYPVLIGTDRVADMYGGVGALPMTFWLDRSGRIVDHVMGLESESLMEDSIKKSLAQGDGSTASTK